MLVRSIERVSQLLAQKRKDLDTVTYVLQGKLQAMRQQQLAQLEKDKDKLIS